MMMTMMIAEELKEIKEKIRSVRLTKQEKN